jgi:hypothetical protein
MKRGEREEEEEKGIAREED